MTVLGFWTQVADFGFWTLVAVFGFSILVPVFGFWTLVTVFGFWTLVTVFGFWTLVADFGFWTLVTARPQHWDLRSLLIARRAWVLQCPLLTSTDSHSEGSTFSSVILRP